MLKIGDRYEELGKGPVTITAVGKDWSVTFVRADGTTDTVTNKTFHEDVDPETGLECGAAKHACVCTSCPPRFKRLKDGGDAR